MSGTTRTTQSHTFARSLGKQYTTRSLSLTDTSARISTIAGSVRVAVLDKYAMRDHWSVLIRTISYNFTDDAETLRSGLFGEFELDPVHYVDPNDSEALHRYHQLWRTQNPTGITTCITDSRGGRNILAVAGCGMFDRMAEEAKAGAPVSIPDRDVLFLPPYPGYDWEDDKKTYEYFRSKYTLNRGRPWIQAVLDKIPVFQPMILFRHRIEISCNGR